MIVTPPRLVEYADLMDEEKRLIFNMLMHGDARVEEVPGLGLKVTLPPSRGGFETRA